MDKEFSILIPCLNEEKTIEICVKKALQYIDKNKMNADVIVVDNGSKDNSIKNIEKYNIKILRNPQIGYGNALIYGIKNIKSKFIIYGDADDSYNFLELDSIIEKLYQGYDLVIGNRYANMEKGAMKLLHKYFGTPIMSIMLRLKYGIKVWDVNSGLRGIKKETIQKLNLNSTGMEFATEIIVKAKKHNLKIIEVPINFYKDKRNHKSHLRTIRDAFRHMKIIINN